MKIQIYNRVVPKVVLVVFKRPSTAHIKPFKRGKWFQTGFQEHLKDSPVGRL